MRFALLLSALLFAPLLRAQNLVPNGSFEEITSCPDDLDQIERAVGWLTFRGSCDLYSICGHPDTAGVPLNWNGEQLPATGDAYAGFVTFSDDDGWPYYVREYLGIQLSSALQPGETYHATFKVSATLSEADQRLMFTSNGMGMLFSTQSFFQADLDPVPGYAQVYSSAVVEDTLGWTLISGSFVADSAYQYVIIGNFFSDEETSWTLTDPEGIWNYAYYYVDDVCVSPDTQYCLLGSGVEQDGARPVQLWLDGPGGMLHAGGLRAAGVVSIRVMDAVGREIKRERVAGLDTWNTATSNWAEGIYVVLAERAIGSSNAERMFLGR